MKAALIAGMIFVAGLAPGLVKHGQPLPHSGSNKAQPVRIYSEAASQERSLLRFLGLRA